MMADKGIQGLFTSMSPSVELASRLFSLANIGLIVSLVVGVISTVLVVWMGNIKEDDLRERLAESSSTAELAKADAAKANEGLAKAHADIAQANERAIEQGAKAEERIALLTKETSEANLEAEQLRGQVAWRELSAEQSELLTRLLSDQPLRLVLEYVGLDPKSTALARQIQLSFARAGLDLQPGGAFLEVGREPTTGMLVSGRVDDVTRMSAALRAVGLFATTESKDADLDVYIGSKPRPN